jgi:site-specific DNA-methyltransferase (adenine-specific)
MSGNIAASIQELAVPVSELRPYSQNPRIGDVGSLIESLKANGQYRPIVVRKGTGEILAGNHTYKAAIELGWNEVAATFVDCDDEQAARIVLVDNRSNDLADYDESVLAGILSELDDLTGSGYSADDLAALLQELGGDAVREGLTDPDDVPGVNAENAITKLDDVWLLGEHRLICGDSTDQRVLDRLMNGKTADLLLTDPPYGVSYVGKTKDALTIDNDERTGDNLKEFLADAFAAASQVLGKGHPFYCFLADSNRVQFDAALNSAGLTPRQSLIWVKNVFVLGRQDYQWRHEPILYGWKEGAAHKWFGGFDKDTVIECARPSRSESHPTTKPVELLEPLITNSSQHGNVVLDIFGGSGSTLIACERLGRKAHLVELDPAYCDVIVKRWQEHTGQTAEVESGKTTKAK